MTNATAWVAAPGHQYALALTDFEWSTGVRVLAGLSVLGAACSAFFQRPGTGWGERARYVAGFVVSMDFVAFWLVPVAAQGALFKLVLLPYVVPVFERIDQSDVLRRFAREHVYRNPRHADFFATQLLFLVNFAAHLALAVVWQVWHGSLPWWLIAVYNFGWVGLGGRAMGAAYAMAHKEGHNTMLYKPAIRNNVGNVFENWVGLFYGGLPYNFSTTHISIHHRLDGGLGDSLYAWDLQRCSFTDFMVYVTRGLLHMSGFGPLRQFLLSRRKVDRRHLSKLAFGLAWYWVAFPAALLWAIPSASFYFWIVLQPLVCMSFSITMLNLGFHAFIEADRIPCVESTTLIGSLDDYFGEDDHMTHHQDPSIYFKDLAAHQAKQRTVWAQHHASVFQGADAFSFALLVLLKAWRILARRFVDYSGTLSEADIARMLETRAKRLEVGHEALLPPLQDPDATGAAPRPRSTFSAPEQPKGGSAIYRAFMRRSLALQQALAEEVDRGLPPVKPVAALSRPDSHEHED